MSGIMKMSVNLLKEMVAGPRRQGFYHRPRRSGDIRYMHEIDDEFNPDSTFQQRRTICDLFCRATSYCL